MTTQISFDFSLDPKEARWMLINDKKKNERLTRFIRDWFRLCPETCARWKIIFVCPHTHHTSTKHTYRSFLFYRDS